MTVNAKARINAYDELPYESFPYATTKPSHLYSIGTLFGVNPVDIESARVLELGCAAGWNIIPHAKFYPKAHFVGIDLSKVQIEQAKKAKEDLGLKNIEFHHCSITDIDDTFGKFDYIICHGIISWVPDFVKAKIFAVCKENLTPNGIACISYNTLPGWNTVRTIRDMMMYHVSLFGDVKDKIVQARAFLNFVKDSLEGADTPYANIVRNEAAMLAKQSDHYLRHDHLEDENKQYYLHEFVANAAQSGLQYLGDATISTMYLGNMPQKVVETLKQLNDIVKTEQYMDFITNRRFRSTLLCHNDVVLNRNLTHQSFEKFNFTFDVTPEKPFAEVDFGDATEQLKFFYQGNKDSNLTTVSAGMKAVLYTFNENAGNPISIQKIISEAASKLKGLNISADSIKQEFLTNMIPLVLQGYLVFTVDKTRKSPKLDKPKVHDLALYQVNNMNCNWAVSFNHAPIGLDLVERIIIKFMDGSRTNEQLLEELIKQVQAGTISVNKDGKPVIELDAIKVEIKAALDHFVKKCAILGLLE